MSDYDRASIEISGNGQSLAMDIPIGMDKALDLLATCEVVGVDGPDERRIFFLKDKGGTVMRIRPYGRVAREMVRVLEIQELRERADLDWFTREKADQMEMLSEDLLDESFDNPIDAASAIRELVARRTDMLNAYREVVRQIRSEVKEHRCLTGDAKGMSSLMSHIEAMIEEVERSHGLSRSDH